ncbi:MAG TPA: serine/threonine-protein kinase [Anaeromyxobacteraceae bacterium]|nr:serine/threonine-protein kinase [Anaeromyxobacteraceae bacterium]
MSVCPTCQTQREEGLPLCPLDGTPLSQSAGLVGLILGDRYRLLSRIGEGGMGTVFLAEHISLGKQVAVKVLRAEYSRDEELVRRFEQEARAASIIDHENVVDVVDFGRTPGGSFYFVMEALEGESLARLIRRDGALPVERALRILAQICQALGAAHSCGVVHRDLKPENVILVHRDDGADLVKVLDFGISKTHGVPEGGRITRAGSIIGTPEYMAPEQAMGGPVDHRCDVYAFGVLAYEMLTGRLPFQGDSPLATLLKHQGEPPVPPSRIRPDLPAEAEAMVLRAMVKRPEGRQQDMAEVSLDLCRALTAVGLAPMMTPVKGLPPVPPPTGTTARFPAPRRPSPPRGETVALESDDVVSAPARRVEEAPAPSPRPAIPTPPPDFDRVRRRPRAVLLGGISAAALAVLGLATGVVPLGRSGPAASPSPAAASPSEVPNPVLASAAPAPALVPVPLLRVTLRSEPPGAAVFRGNDRIGATPLDVEMEAGGEAEYRFARSGFRALARRVRASDGVVEVRLARAEPRAVKELGAKAADDENPYGKVDDLKPDPFQ